MLKSLSSSYSALNSLSFITTPLLSDELVVKESDNELIWQQISMQNKGVFKEVKKTLKLFGDDLKIPEESLSDESEEDDEEMEEESYVEDEDEEEEIEEPPQKKKKVVDLFNLRETDLKNLDAKLKALEEEDDDDEDDEAEDGDDEEDDDEKIPAPPTPLKSHKKSKVDDKFFNLSEMESFLDQNVGEISDLDDDDNDEDFETDYRYKDFFEASAPKKKSDKKVRFEESTNIDEEDDDDEEEAEDGDEEEYDNDEENEETPVLLSTKKEVSKPLSSHEHSREKMSKLIDKIQSENLNPRSWELSGEVKSDDREVNSLLEKYVEADFRKKQPPINSKEKSDKIQNICLRRYKDKLFDDVVRKYRDDDSIKPYRNLTVDMNERKSLMDVYEDKYQSAQNGDTESTEDIDPQVKDIQKQMNDVFFKLDALSHFQFAPSRISEEIRMVKNMPSMRAEEVGPMASAAADETLLAPEEISRHVKKAPKSKDERTTTDKQQERRKKKRKQHEMAKAGKMPKVGKEKVDENAPGPSTKKGKKKDFFAEIQNIARREIKDKKDKAAEGGEKVSKKTKKPKDKSETAAKYKA